MSPSGNPASGQTRDVQRCMSRAEIRRDGSEARAGDSPQRGAQGASALTGRPWGKDAPRRAEGRVALVRSPLLSLHTSPPTGETTTAVAPQVPGGVSDGRWHSVRVQYYNKVGGCGPRGPWAARGGRRALLRPEPFML